MQLGTVLPFLDPGASLLPVQWALHRQSAWGISNMRCKFERKRRYILVRKGMRRYQRVEKQWVSYIFQYLPSQSRRLKFVLVICAQIFFSL
jgi:hypothetical protein